MGAEKQRHTEPRRERWGGMVATIDSRAEGSRRERVGEGERGRESAGERVQVGTLA